MRISIALATYNGGRYLEEQLNSFLAQTNLPDELVVNDDGSTDETLPILEAFSSRAPFKVSIYENDHNLGYARNFEKAISRCSGDIIFLSDQDDVWLPKKIETMCKAFEDNPKIFVVISDTKIVDERLTDTGLTQLGQFRNLGLRDEDFISGFCTAFRSSLLSLLLPLPEGECFSHDKWIHSLANRLDVRMLLDVPLQLYRRHGENATNYIASHTSPVSAFDIVNTYKHGDPRPYCRKRLSQLAILHEHISNHLAGCLDKLGISKNANNALQEIAIESRAAHNRLNILNKARFFRLFPSVQMYLKGEYLYFSGWKSMVKDLIKN